jgi:hypothetical protein
LELVAIHNGAINSQPTLVNLLHVHDINVSLEQSFDGTASGIHTNGNTTVDTGYLDSSFDTKKMLAVA